MSARWPEPGEIWMGNFEIACGFKPMLISALSGTSDKKNTVLIVSKVEGHAQHGSTHYCRQLYRLIALGLCEGKIVGIESIDMSDFHMKLTRIM